MVYEELAQVLGLSVGLTTMIFVTIAIVDLIIRGFALWFSAGKKQAVWFVCLLIFNTAGILPLIYILIYKPWKKGKKKK